MAAIRVDQHEPATLGKGAVRVAIMGACGLLGFAGHTAEATEVNTAVLGYTEPNRVSAFEAIVNGVHDLASGKSLNFRLVFDSLSGASANGAAPASVTQTFTRPSGTGEGDDKASTTSYTQASGTGSTGTTALSQGSYHTNPGDTPLDDTFHDTRVAGTVGLTSALDRLTNFSVGLYGSGEFDYTSLGTNLGLTRDFNRRNTTLALRGAFFHDTSRPIGGRPVPFSPMQPFGTPKAVLPGNGTKQTLDLGAGVTQVLNRKTVLHLNYTHSKVTDYQTDPYKILSVVDPVSGDPRTSAPYLYESRPDDRRKDVVFMRLIRHLGRDVVHLSFRYYRDNWGVTSRAVDLTYRWNLGDGKYLKPHGRYYNQSATNFYHRYLVDGEALPDHASADYRLGDMHTVTYGLTYGHLDDDGHEFTIRGEYYAQMGESHPADAIGNLKSYDLFPTVDAFILQVGYSFNLLP